MPRPYKLGKRLVGIENTRQRIIGATVELIRERGLINTHINQIADRAGVTRPTVYQQFGTKEDLWAAAFSTTIGRPNPDRIRKAIDQGYVAGARSWLKVWLDFWASETDLIRQSKLMTTVESSFLPIDRRLEMERMQEARFFADHLHVDQALVFNMTTVTALTMLDLLSSFWTFDTLLQRLGTPAKVKITVLKTFDQTMLGKR